MKCFNDLPEDIKQSLFSQLRTIWTHTSTAIEGNTLTLGETDFVISEGLTISGKPLKDHRDIMGHARAVDMIFDLVKKDEFERQDLFNLHLLVIAEQILDAYKPVGEWKNTDNSTSTVINGIQGTISYSRHYETPDLMEKWLQMLNESVKITATDDEVLDAYTRLHLAFVSIHPFFDGNGRIARLVSNIPCLKAGFPPIVIGTTSKNLYKQAIAEYQTAHGVPTRGGELVITGVHFDRFKSFCSQNWQPTIQLLNDARNLQSQRILQENEYRLASLSSPP